MINNSLLCLKRTANLVTKQEDINATDNILLDLARKIFAFEYHLKNKNPGLALYQTGIYRHPANPSYIIEPHFVREDGIVIFLQLKQKDEYLNTVDTEFIHIAMDILKLDTAKLFTIILDDNTDYKKISTINKKHYKTITEETIKYSQKIVDKHIIPVQNNKKQKRNTSSEIKNDKFIASEWVSASKTRNYALRNTLVDWLDHWYDRTTEKNDFERPPTVNNNEYNFGKFIMNKGVEFESEVIKLIREKLNDNEFVKICKSYDNFYNKVFDYEQATQEEIRRGTPVIYQGLLMNHSGDLCNSYGMPDLIVRSDYINKIISDNPVPTDMINYKAANLSGNYHYVVVDIKFTTVELCFDGIRIRNYGSIPAYKCQLYIYNHALGVIQGYEPAAAYILGRRYKYESKKKTYCFNDCFSKMGVIQYDKWDNNYIEETINAVKWIKRLRTEGQNWKLYPTPTIPELYPNMASAGESNWDNMKAQYAKKINEITLLWNCGVKNREIANNNGVYTFDDPKCSAKMLGIYGEKQAPILDEIININRKRKFTDKLDYISMKLNNKFDNQWLEKHKLRLTVDFETINCVFDDFSSLPNAQDYNYLFMIGVSYQIHNQEYKYKMFLAAELSSEAEYEMVEHFYKFLRQLTDEYVGKNYPIPSLYHWGHMERSFFDGLCTRLVNKLGHNISARIAKIKQELNWYDLCDSFKQNKIVINGCFKFGLKEIATRLSELKLIKSTWNKESACLNGNAAMIIAKQAYDSSYNTNSPVIKTKAMREIMEYNRTDCIVIHEIIDLLKEKSKSRKIRKL